MSIPTLTFYILEGKYMVNYDELFCPNCGGKLKYYDSVSRMVRGKFRRVKHIKIRRLRCIKCKCIHRELPNCIFPYKQYDAEIIRGVIEEIITCETLDYEDYPCEMTMIRWISQKSQFLL